jgi:hypothetical protein
MRNLRRAGAVMGDFSNRARMMRVSRDVRKRDEQAALWGANACGLELRAPSPCNPPAYAI